MENNIVAISKPIFYRKFVDETCSRRKLGDNFLFDWFNNCHPNIKLTIEVNPSTFLYIKLTNFNGTYKFKVYEFTMDLQKPKTLKTKYSQ